MQVWQEAINKGVDYICIFDRGLRINRQHPSIIFNTHAEAVNYLKNYLKDKPKTLYLVYEHTEQVINDEWGLVHGKVRLMNVNLYYDPMKRKSPKPNNVTEKEIKEYINSFKKEVKEQIEIIEEPKKTEIIQMELF